MSQATYSAYIWDHEAQEFVYWHIDLVPGDGGGEAAWSRLSKWGLRAAIRRLRAKGWSELSVLIERNIALA